jgi:transposase InsO family protein
MSGIARQRVEQEVAKAESCHAPSFWSTLKLELVYRRAFASHLQARTEIFDYIEGFYNRQRIHSALNYLSLTEFETTTN